MGQQLSISDLATEDGPKTTNNSPENLNYLSPISFLIAYCGAKRFGKAYRFLKLCARLATFNAFGGFGILDRIEYVNLQAAMNMGFCIILEYVVLFI